MARKPAHLQAVGKLTPCERIWAAIRALGACCAHFTRADIDDWCAKHAPAGTVTRRVEEATIAWYVAGLVAAGYLQRTRLAGRYAKAHYTLARDVGVAAPRVDRQGREATQGRVTLALWRAMHIHKQFDYRELTAWAAVESVRVAPDTAITYCQYLARAGYLQVMQPAKSGAPARYRLAKYTGPKAPLIQKVKHLYDPNLGEVVWHPAADA